EFHPLATDAHRQVSRVDGNRVPMIDQRVAAEGVQYVSHDREVHHLLAHDVGERTGGVLVGSGHEAVERGEIQRDRVVLEQQRGLQARMQVAGLASGADRVDGGLVDLDHWAASPRSIRTFSVGFPAAASGNRGLIPAGELTTSRSTVRSRPVIADAATWKSRSIIPSSRQLSQRLGVVGWKKLRRPTGPPSGLGYAPETPRGTHQVSAFHPP